MTPTTGFALEKHTGPYEKWPLKTRLFFEGADTGTSVPGFCIEAQYQGNDYSLLALSWDCPFEEANDFVLLDLAFKPLARTRLGGMYTTFLLESHTPVAPDVVRLAYNGGLKYDLTVVRETSIWSRKPRLVLRRRGV